MKTKPPASPSPRLRLSAAHSRAFRKFANLLEVRPDDFLKWQLDYLLADLSSPSHRLLAEWAESQIYYHAPGQKERVKTRVAAWLKGRKEAAA